MGRKRRTVYVKGYYTRARVFGYLMLAALVLYLAWSFYESYTA